MHREQRGVDLIGLSSSGVLATICTSVLPRLHGCARRTGGDTSPAHSRLAPGRAKQALELPRSRAAQWRCACRAIPGRSDFCFERPRAPRLLGSDAIGLAEIDAAGEGELAIDHHDLAMVALVDAGETLIERIQRIECAQRDAGVAKRVEKFLRRCVSEPDRVVQHVRRSRRALRACVSNALKRPIACGGFLEDEALDQDVAAAPVSIAANIAA